MEATARSLMALALTEGVDTVGDNWLRVSPSGRLPTFTGEGRNVGVQGEEPAVAVAFAHEMQNIAATNAYVLYIFGGTSILIIRLEAGQSVASCRSCVRRPRPSI